MEEILGLQGLGLSSNVVDQKSILPVEHDQEFLVNGLREISQFWQNAGLAVEL